MSRKKDDGVRPAGPGDGMGFGGRKGIDGGVEKVGEEGAAFAKDSAKDFGEGKDKLPVGNIETDAGGDPCGVLQVKARSSS